MAWVETERNVRMAECRRCSHRATQLKFRLLHQADRVMANGTVERIREFDGILQCPRCRTAFPREWKEVVKDREWRADLFEDAANAGG